MEKEFQIGEKVFVADVNLNEIFEGVMTDEGVHLIQRHPYYDYRAYGEFFRCREEADSYLKREIASIKMIFKEKGPIETMFRAWANIYPDGQEQVAIEAMKEILKEIYNIEI